MSPEKQVPHLKRFFLKWQEVVASVHVSRETGPTFETFFFEVAGGGGVRTCLQRNRSHIFNVFF